MPRTTECVWCGGRGFHEATCRRGVDPRPGSANARIVAYVRDEPCTTSSDIAADFGLDIYDASTRLRELWERGLLERQKVVKPDAGRNGRASGRSTVYVYSVAG